MDREPVTKILELLGAKHIVQREGWVGSSCPFAPYNNRHENGTDSRNSFGIKIGEHSYYNCFTCNTHGPLSTFPTSLSYYTHESYDKIREIISRYEGWFTTGSEIKKELLPMNDIILERFFLYKPDGLITQETINEWNLRQDVVTNRMLTPIRDANNRLVGLRGRYLGGDKEVLKWKVYKELNNGSADAKFSGIWLGMHRELQLHNLLTLVEGDRDVLLLTQYGIPNVWGSMGASLAKAQLETLKKYNLPILIFMDNDSAGIEAANTIYKTMKGLVPLYKIGNYYGCKDGAELFEKELLDKALETKEEL